MHTGLEHLDMVYMVFDFVEWVNRWGLELVAVRVFYNLLYE